ncbi:MAG: DUF2905 domain-containing protein [Chloroflexi bacterium]|nr:DUF2905 domain-containing protein [Chloroflexota bacterium]
MDLNTVGRLVLIAGVGLVVLGGLLMLLSRVPVLKHLGHLPGDIRMEGENYSCFFPLTSMIIISVLLTLVVNIIVRLVNR